jgi:ABC-2 type transport system permease protein
MRSVIALIRVHWLTFTSYRMNVVFSLAGLVAMLVPVYLVGRSLQPVVARSIAEEGGVYFGFLIAGLAMMQLVGMSIRALPNSISSGIGSGTLEALFATPTPLPELLAGMMGYGLLWAAFRAVLLMIGMAALGGPLAVDAIPLAAAILILTALAHLPIGVMMAAAVLVFRVTGPLVPALLGIFSLLGGVYYSTTVVPEVVRPLTSFIPLTYGLRAFRQSLLSGEPLHAVAGDLATLAIFIVILAALSVVTFAGALRYARRTGTLGQY